MLCIVQYICCDCVLRLAGDRVVVLRARRTARAARARRRRVRAGLLSASRRTRRCAGALVELQLCLSAAHLSEFLFVGTGLYIVSCRLQVRLRDTLVPLCATLEHLNQEHSRPRTQHEYTAAPSSLESGVGQQQQQQQMQANSKRKRTRSRTQSQSQLERGLEQLEWAEPRPGHVVRTPYSERRGLPELELPYSVERVRFRRCVLALALEAAPASSPAHGPSSTRRSE